MVAGIFIIIVEFIVTALAKAMRRITISISIPQDGRYRSSYMIDVHHDGPLIMFQARVKKI